MVKLRQSIIDFAAAVSRALEPIMKAFGAMELEYEAGADIACGMTVYQHPSSGKIYPATGHYYRRAFCVAARDIRKGEQLTLTVDLVQMAAASSNVRVSDCEE
jgi:hypothetical protein